ncbi:MAG: 6-phospho-beta-glucosidase [Gaiellaceae bacterium]|nr:6-phospho-beta-glucosidase [Gaiellaceae bacterium]
MSAHRLVVLGGSSVSTPGLALALRALPEDARFDLVLHGRSQEKLDAVGRACEAVLGPVERHSDLAAALRGADLVLNQVRVGGLEARRFDETFPRELGLVAEETLGAGGFANARRTIPVVLELARAVERHAPQATLVNLTNPASLVHQALVRETRVRAISVCDVPVTLERSVYELAGARPGTLRVDYYGTNHIGWVTAACDERGHDRLPDVLARLGNGDRASGVLPGPYLRYLYEPERFAAANGKTRAAELLDVEAEMLAEYAALSEGAGPEDVERVVSRRAPHWYEEIVVPVLVGCVSPERRRVVVQTANGDLDPALPPAQTVELPVELSRAGLTPERPAPLPRDCRALLEENAAYEGLAVEAIVEDDRDKARRALALNPLVGGAKADAVLEAAWPD